MFTALKGSQFYFLFAITAADVSPHTSFIVMIIFSFWSFEISEDILIIILGNQKTIIGLDTFSNQDLI